ncbi:ribonuclease Z, partial [Klebsiella pneumoniae]|nr:ribonuclease Z [Klebsiella pneumoniae]
TSLEVGPGLGVDEEGARVTADPLSHPGACAGSRIAQHDKPGTRDAAQQIAEGVPPGPLFHQIKRGQRGTLADGRVCVGSLDIG